MEENPENKNQEEVIYKRKQKIKNWFSNKYNLIFFGILILGFFLRVYYLFYTKMQAHWWDSLCYGSLAKESIYHLWTNYTLILGEQIIRPPLLPFLWSLLIRLNASDFFSIFILQIIPSFICVIFTFLIAKKMFNEKIALISSFLISVSWMHLFYSIRMLTEIPSLALMLVSVYFFLNFLENEKTSSFTLSILFLSFAILMRYPSGLLGVIYLLFLVFTKRFKIFIKKSFWIGGLLGVIPLLIFFIRNLIIKGSFFPAVAVYSSSAANKPSFAFYTLTQLTPHIFQLFLFVFFIIGVIFALFELVIGTGFISKTKHLQSIIFSLIIIIIWLCFFIFWMRAAEDRYLFMIVPFIFFLISNVVILIYNFFKKYSGYFAIVILIFFLLISAYYQLSYGHQMIKDKRASFYQMKEAFLWIKDNTPKNSVLGFESLDPYAIHYAERQYITLHKNISDSNFNLTSVDYVILSIFHPQSQEVLDYLSKKQDKLLPVQAYFLDSNNKQPAVIIYQVKK